jgi:hypothetical protein
MHNISIEFITFDNNYKQRQFASTHSYANLLAGKYNHLMEFLLYIKIGDTCINHRLLIWNNRYIK